MLLEIAGYLRCRYAEINAQPAERIGFQPTARLSSFGFAETR